MRVKRIVTNIAADPDHIAEAKRFYAEIFGLDVLMDLGWIATYGSKVKMTVQLSIMTEGGSGTLVPDLSIEVDDLDAALERVRKAGFRVVRFSIFATISAQMRRADCIEHCPLSGVTRKTFAHNKFFSVVAGILVVEEGQ
jgi:predicted enzyme related to lactoylglutathione lyase